VAGGRDRGLLYAFSPLRAQNLPALQMESAWLLRSCSWRRARRRRRRRGLGVALAFGLAVQALSSYYVGYASLIVVAVVLGAVGLDRTSDRTGALVAAIGAALAVVAACSVPYLVVRAEARSPSPIPPT